MTGWNAARRAWIIGFVTAGIGAGCTANLEETDGTPSFEDVSQPSSLAARADTGTEATGDYVSLKSPDAVACGGRLGENCAEGQYCAYYGMAEACGWADATAHCEDQPAACTLEYEPVCGCDGTSYANACMAAHNGVGVLYEGACGRDRVNTLSYSRPGDDPIADTTITCNGDTNICTCIQSGGAGDCEAKLSALCDSVVAGSDFGIGEDCPEVVASAPGLPSDSYVTETHVAFASIDINCAGKTYKLDTGNSSGSCTTSQVGGSCDDGNGNGASLNCADYPDNPCIQSSGSGSCSCTNC